MEYTFTLKYQLTEDDSDPDGLVERLGEAGCDDALVSRDGWRWSSPERRTARTRPCAAPWLTCATPYRRSG